MAEGRRAVSVCDVLASIRRVAEACGRDASEIQLVAVSKQQPDDVVEAALAAGQRVFGENRVQEALQRWSARRDRFPDLTLHLVGPLQTNKVRAALELFDVIETVDRERIAARISEIGKETGRRPRLYVQVNTGEEPQKAGVAPSATAQFVAACREEYGLEIEGLMAIPPADAPPAPHFALLAKLADEAGAPKLSMGMSGDFEEAVQMGATSVRVGSAVFGARPARG